MPTSEISETVALPREIAPRHSPRPSTESETREEAWERRCQGILNGTLPPFTDEEIIEMADHRYEELQSGKSRGLTWEEYQLFHRLADEFPHLSNEAIFEEIDRRAEEQKVKDISVEEYALAI